MSIVRFMRLGHPAKPRFLTPYQPRLATMHSFRARIRWWVRLKDEGCATGRVSALAVRGGCHHCVMRPLVGSDSVFDRRALCQLCEPPLTLLRYCVRQTDHRIHLGIQSIQHLRVGQPDNTVRKEWAPAFQQIQGSNTRYMQLECWNRIL